MVFEQDLETKEDVDIGGTIEQFENNQIPDYHDNIGLSGRAVKIL